MLVSPFGGFGGTVDTALQKIGLKRHVGYAVGNFSLAPRLLQNSELIVTLPESIAGYFAKLHGLRIFDCPIEVPKFDVHLLWHERTRQSPLHQWFRGLFQR